MRESPGQGRSAGTQVAPADKVRSCLDGLRAIREGLMRYRDHQGCRWASNGLLREEQRLRKVIEQLEEE